MLLVEGKAVPASGKTVWQSLVTHTRHVTQSFHPGYSKEVKRLSTRRLAHRCFWKLYSFPVAAVTGHKLGGLKQYKFILWSFWVRHACSVPLDWSWGHENDSYGASGGSTGRSSAGGVGGDLLSGLSSPRGPPGPPPSSHPNPVSALPSQLLLLRVSDSARLPYKDHCTHHGSSAHQQEMDKQNAYSYNLTLFNNKTNYYLIQTKHGCISLTLHWVTETKQQRIHKYDFIYTKLE